MFWLEAWLVRIRIRVYDLEIGLFFGVFCFMSMFRLCVYGLLEMRVLVVWIYVFFVYSLNYLFVKILDCVELKIKKKIF